MTVNAKRVWNKIFETKHSKCIFDVWTEDGKIHRNLDYSKVYIGTKSSPTEQKLFKIRFHCYDCINPNCSSKGKKGHTIISDKRRLPDTKFKMINRRAC